MTDLVAKIASFQDYDQYRDLHWDGSFEDYLAIVKERPQVTRNAFQRVYDMIIRYGTEEYTDNKKKLIRYNFFKDEKNGGKDAVYGLDIPLMRLVNVFRAAAKPVYRHEVRVFSHVLVVTDLPPDEAAAWGARVQTFLSGINGIRYTVVDASRAPTVGDLLAAFLEAAGVRGAAAEHGGGGEGESERAHTLMIGIGQRARHQPEATSSRCRRASRFATSRS